MNDKIKVGLITLVIASLLIVYVQFREDLKIRVDADKSTFYVQENNRWVVSGREYNSIFNGSKKLSRDLSSIKIDTVIDNVSKEVKITRYTKYQKGTELIDTYLFNGAIDSKELFPVSHTIEVINGKGLFYRYEVKDLVYDGETDYKATSPASFGRNMKVEFQDGYSYAHIYSSGILRVQYPIKSDYQKFNVRLFDPDSSSLSNGMISCNDFNLALNDSINLSYNLRPFRNAVYTTNGKIGGGYIFDGAGDGLNYTTTNLSLGQNWTISFWANASAIQTNRYVIGLLDQNGTRQFAWYYWLVDSNWYQKPTGTQYSYAEAFDISRWYNYVMIKNGTNIYTYTNGTLTKVQSGVIDANLSVAILGSKDSDDVNYGWIGTLDEFMAWNRSLTNSEISILYNNSIGFDCNLIPGGGGTYLNLDGVNTSRKYEVNTTVNITTDYDYLSIYDETNRYVDYLSSSLQYVLSVLRFPASSVSVGNASNFNLTVDNRSDLYDARFNITGTAKNLSFRYEDYFVYLPGGLFNDMLNQTSFYFSDTIYTSYNLSFRSAEKKVIYINHSAEGSSIPRNGLNLTLTAYNLDTGNAFNFNSTFYDINTSNTSEIGTAYPIGGFDTDSTFECFANNATQSRWSGDFSFSQNQGKCEDSYQPNYLGSDDTCILMTGAVPGTSFYSSYIDFSMVDYVTFQYSSTCDCTCMNKLELTDGSTSIEIDRTETYNCPYYGSPGASTCNYTMTRIGNIWTVSVPPTNPGGCSTPTIDTSSLNTPYYIKLSAVQGDTSGATSYSYEYFLKNINFGGISLNRTNVSISGIEGAGAGTSFTSNFTSHMLNNTPNAISRAILTYNAFIPSGTNVSAFLSNDNGLNFESVDNATSHLFLTTGNKTRVRFHLESNNNITTPLITYFQVKVVESSLQNLSIDVGDDGSNEYEYGYVLNSTTTPLVVSNSSYIDNYIDTRCTNNSFCLIPLAFISGSGGVIQLSNLNYSRVINPITLNASVLDSKQLIQVNLTYGSGSAITVSGQQFDYWGNKNITISAHTLNHSSEINHSINVTYSKFGITFPPNVYYWELFPRKRVENNTQPYGQNTSDGFWKINMSLAYHPFGIDVYLKYNESLNSCITDNLFVGYNYTNHTQKNISVSTASQVLIVNSSLTNITTIWTYTDINCSGINDTLINPYFCFFSLCSGCVKTSDWNNTCGEYI